MKALRRKIRKSDIYWWVDSFLKSVFSRELKSFPPLHEYMHLEPFEPFQGDSS